MFTQTEIASKFTEISLVSLQKGAYMLEISINGTMQKRTVIRE